MPKKPNIKEWLLEQQKKLDAENDRKGLKQSVKPAGKKVVPEWIAQWNKEQEEADERYGVNSVAPKEQKSVNAIEPNPWKDWKWKDVIKKPDPPMRRFPTSSGELYFGRVPEYSTLAKLRDMGVDTIWNLGAELAAFVQHERAYVDHVIQGDVPDFGIPTNPTKFLKQAQVVASLLKTGKKVFVHCHGGVGRTSMALATIQLLMSNDNGELALQKANEAANGPDTEQQERFVEALARQLKRPVAEKVSPVETVSKEQTELDKIIGRYEQKSNAPAAKTDEERDLHRAKLKQRLELLQWQRDRDKAELQRQENIRIIKRYKEQQEAKKKPKKP